MNLTFKQILVTMTELSKNEFFMIIQLMTNNFKYICIDLLLKFKTISLIKK